MPVLPIKNIQSLTQRYAGLDAPADLLVLATRKVGFGPEGTDGSAMPNDKISPYSGIYDENGHLPALRGAGSNYIAHI
mgnify:CR=1 FL=1